VNKKLELSKKQCEFVKHANKRWNGKIGATRCGKTFLDFVYTIPSRILERKGMQGINFILGVSKSTIERNVLEPMRKHWGDKLVTTINSENIAKIFGEKVYCLGAEKVSQVSKLRGAEAKYIYWDELVDCNEEVFNLAKSSVSVPKDTVSTIFNESKIFIAPYAKFSALEIEYNKGSSITKSTPFFIAISALDHLSNKEGSPL
jgi:hypothetical protein